MHGKCHDCEHNGLCRVVQEEVYDIGGRQTIIGVVECGHYMSNNAERISQMDVSPK